jgi:hypothetical protein
MDALMDGEGGRSSLEGEGIGFKASRIMDREKGRERQRVGFKEL